MKHLAKDEAKKWNSTDALPLCSICWATMKSNSRRRCGWQKTQTTSKSRKVLSACNVVSVLVVFKGKNLTCIFLLLYPWKVCSEFYQSNGTYQLLTSVACSHRYLRVCMFVVSAFREGRKDSAGEEARDLQRKEGNWIQPEELEHEGGLGVRGRLRRWGLKSLKWTLLVRDAKSYNQTETGKRIETQLVKRVRGPRPWSAICPLHP